MAWGNKGLKSIVKEEQHVKNKGFAETREGSSFIHLGKKVSTEEVQRAAWALGFAVEKFRNALVIKDGKGLLVAKLTPLPRINTVFIDAKTKRKKEALKLAQDLL